MASALVIKTEFIVSYAAFTVTQSFAMKFSFHKLPLTQHSVDVKILYKKCNKTQYNK